MYLSEFSILISISKYNTADCLLNNWRIEVAIDLMFPTFERGTWGKWLYLKIWYADNWPIRWIFDVHSTNNILKRYFILVRILWWPFDRKNRSLSIYMSPTLLACFLLELQGFLQDPRFRLTQFNWDHPKKHIGRGNSSSWVEWWYLFFDSKWFDTIILVFLKLWLITVQNGKIWYFENIKITVSSHFESKGQNPN